MLAFVDSDGEREEVSPHTHTAAEVSRYAPFIAGSCKENWMWNSRRDRFEPYSGISSAIQEDPRSSCFLSEV